MAKNGKNDKKFDGYEMAKEWDKKVEELLKKNPITKDNSKEWWKFARIVKSSMEILERTVIDQLANKITEDIKISTKQK